MNTQNIFARLTARMLTAIILLPALGLGFAGPSATTAAYGRTANAAQLAPANDNLSSAQVLPGLSGTATGATTGATKEPAEPSHAKNRGGASIWYKYVAAGNSVLTVSTSGSN